MLIRVLALIAALIWSPAIAGTISIPFPGPGSGAASGAVTVS